MYDQCGPMCDTLWTKCVPAFRGGAWATPPSYVIYIQPLPDTEMGGWRLNNIYYLELSALYLVYEPNNQNPINPFHNSFVFTELE